MSEQRWTIQVCSACGSKLRWVGLGGDEQWECPDGCFDNRVPGTVHEVEVVPQPDLQASQEREEKQRLACRDALDHTMGGHGRQYDNECEGCREAAMTLDTLRDVDRATLDGKTPSPTTRETKLEELLREAYPLLGEVSVSVGPKRCADAMLLRDRIDSLTPSPEEPNEH